LVLVRLRIADANHQISRRVGIETGRLGQTKGTLF
jgi:hypothetical protein